MQQDLNPVLLVKPLPIEAEYFITLSNEPIDCNDSGSVSCGKPGKL
jgi:hypothetical protein